MSKSTLVLARRAFIANCELALYCEGRTIPMFLVQMTFPASVSRKTRRKVFAQKCAMWRTWGVIDITPYP